MPLAAHPSGLDVVQYRDRVIEWSTRRNDTQWPGRTGAVEELEASVRSLIVWWLTADAPTSGGGRAARARRTAGALWEGLDRLLKAYRDVPPRLAALIAHRRSAFEADPAGVTIDEIERAALNLESEDKQKGDAPGSSKPRTRVPMRTDTNRVNESSLLTLLSVCGEISAFLRDLPHESVPWGELGLVLCSDIGKWPESRCMAAGLGDVPIKGTTLTVGEWVELVGTRDEVASLEDTIVARARLSDELAQCTGSAGQVTGLPSATVFELLGACGGTWKSLGAYEKAVSRARATIGDFLATTPHKSVGRPRDLWE